MNLNKHKNSSSLIQESKTVYHSGGQSFVKPKEQGSSTQEVIEEKPGDFATIANTTTTSSSKGGMILPVINHASSGYEGINPQAPSVIISSLASRHQQ
jgi:hypothetical protein